jgi:hypothetical protein
MVPLQQVGPNREKMESAVRRIESTGGGIYVYEGLKAAWDQLKTAPAGQRHIILFSDAADSEEPGDYKRLIDDILAGSGTASVIALGQRSDADAALLEDIAKRGKGRLFFTEKAEELPNIFSQETVAVARSLRAVGSRSAVRLSTGCPKPMATTSATCVIGPARASSRRTNTQPRSSPSASEASAGPPRSALPSAASIRRKSAPGRSMATFSKPSSAGSWASNCLPASV